MTTPPQGPSDPVEEFLAAFHARCDDAGVPREQRHALLADEAAQLIDRVRAGDRVAPALAEWASRYLLGRGGVS